MGGRSGDHCANYNPVIDPANFPATPLVNNQYFPLVPGTTFHYRNTITEGATVTTQDNPVEVTSDIKVILGVNCVVVHDQTYEGGNLVEDTFDWYAQDNEGNVWYFGEDTKEYEGGQVMSTAGSWEAGVSGAVAGIIMKADPQVGDRYQQEYLKGEAEDMAEVLALNETATVPYGSFTRVLRTKEWTPLEPGVEEEKLYAPGIGLIKVEVVKGGSGIEELLQMITP